MRHRLVMIAIFSIFMAVSFFLIIPSIQASDMNARAQKLGDLSQGSLTMKRMTTMQLAFTENQGRWDDWVSFRSNAGRAIDNKSLKGV